MHRRSAAALFAALATTAGIAAPAASATTPTNPPPLTVLSQTGSLGDRDIFITPSGAGSTTYAGGPEILSPSGKVIWFDPAPAGLTSGDFRTQTYDGKPVLTFWEGTGFGGLSTGTDYIYNSRYQQIATVNAGNGLSADGHEFLITPWNTALILPTRSPQRI